MSGENLTIQEKPRDWSSFIVHNTPGAIITGDARGRITEFNPAAEKLTGFSREEALGRLAEEVLYWQRGDQNYPLDLVMKGQEEGTMELTLQNRSGQKVPVMMSSFALRDEHGIPRGAALIIRDLTPIKRQEMERRQLINMVAHDLKTPVVGAAGLIRRLLQGKLGALSESQKAYLETIYREMEMLENLITSFLEFARLDLRIMTPQLKPIQVEKEIREVISLMLPLAEAKEIGLETVFPSETSPLEADPLLFRRVLENLLENAIKYGPPHSKVVLEVRELDAEVRIAVKDQGPGITPEDLPHLFEMFYRGQGAGDKPGFGLGLATVRRIIDVHGGRLWVDTGIGRGTTFFFTFPLKTNNPSRS